MYGKIFLNDFKKFVIYGQDEREYYLDNIKKNLKKDDIVIFNNSSSTGNRRKVRDLEVFSPRGIDKQNLKKIYEKWNQEATRESNDLFAITEKAKEIQSGKKIFVIGRKGVGKSALAKHLLNSEEFIGDIYSFENFPFKEFYLLESEGFSHSKYKPVWEIMYLSFAITLLIKHKDTPALVKKKTYDYLAKLNGTNFLNKFSDYLQNTLAKITGAGVSSVIGVDPVAILNLVGEAVESSKDKSVKFLHDELNSIVKDLKELISSFGEFPKILIAFDQLDEEYKARNDIDSDRYSDVIKSLFAASQAIDADHLGIQPLVLLRDDIYNSFEGANKTKYFDKTLELNWTPGELKEVIQFRLNKTFGYPVERSFDRVWLDIFTPFFYRIHGANQEGAGSGKNMGSSYECFIRHTTRTPRDCIQLLINITKKMVVNQSKYCDHDLFKSARNDMGDYFRQQIIDAAHVSQPQINDVFRIITENSQSLTNLFSKSKLKKLIHEELPDSKLNVDDLLKTLYDVAAIGISSIDQKKYRAKYTGADTYYLRKIELIRLHPILALKLGMNVSVTGNNSDELVNAKHKIDDDQLSDEIEAKIKKEFFDLEMINSSNSIEDITNRLKVKFWTFECVEVNKEDLYANFFHRKFEEKITLKLIESSLPIKDQFYACDVTVEFEESTNKNLYVIKSYKAID